MPIITYDQLIAAIAGGQKPSLHKTGGTALTSGAGYTNDMALRTGFPTAMTAPSVGLNGEVLTKDTAGMLPFSNAGGSAQKYLAAAQLVASVAGSAFLYDRLWQNSGITVTTTTLQSFSAPVQLPARDENGQNAGVGVEAWLEVYTATTNAAAILNATITYTNSSGVGGRVGTLSTIPADALAGTMVPMLLQAGDKGVQKVDGITLGTSLVTGAVGVVLLRRLAMFPAPIANTGYSFGWEQIATKLQPDSALSLMFVNTNTNLPWVWFNPIFVEG